MKRIVTSLLLLITLAVTISCQEPYQTPQTVGWDDDVFSAGTYQYTQIQLIEYGASKTIESNYTLVGSTTSDYINVDLNSLGLPEGDYVVAVRYRVEYDGVEQWEPRAYSDVEADVDPTEGRFLIRLRPNKKPMRLRIL